MELDEVIKQLRLVLYKDLSCDEIKEQFENILSSNGYSDITVDITEDDKVIIVDLPSYTQFFKRKKPCKRIYQVVNQ